MTPHYETQTFDMKARLEERMTRAQDIRKAFRTFQLEVARSSENSRTGKPIPERIIQVTRSAGSALPLPLLLTPTKTYAGAGSHVQGGIRDTWEGR